MITFDLPTDIVSASDDLHLGILPVVTDGVDYYNLQGPHPPELIVTYQ